MIALVSSTVFPPTQPGHDGPRTWLTDDERLEQTRRTVRSLVDVGARDIVIADNSGARWRPGTEADLHPARVLLVDTPQFRNKGISEMHMLRRVLEELPESEPVLKVSGRYRVTRDLCEVLGDHDVAARIHHHGRNWSMSTRCYAVRDRATYARLLDDAFREQYAWAARIVGPRSLLRIIRSSVRPSADRFPYDDPPGSIEGAWGRALQLGGYRVRAVDEIGVEGYAGGLAGAFVRE